MNDLRSKNFLAYVIPSVLGFALSGVYTIVDGFFIGHALGDEGIAAITLGYPVSVLLQAMGTGIGLSGAIRYSILTAQNKKKESEECFTAAALLMLLFSLVLTVVLFTLTEEIMTLLGASGRVHALGVEYVRILSLGALFQLMATGLVPFIRNMNGAAFAMVSMILGFGTNIVLDYLFIWVYPWGAAGGAAATVIGQAVTLVAALGFFLWKKCRLHLPGVPELLALWKQILKLAISPFGLTFSSTLTLLFMNRFLVLYGDQQQVAVFGCMDYILSILYLLLQGVGDGSQPLISSCYGKEDWKGMRQVRGLVYRFAVGLTLGCMILVFLLRSKVGVLFGASEATNLEVMHYLPWFLATALFLCFSRITTTYFYATENTLYSYLLVYGEPLGTLLMLCVLPLLGLGLTGVWLAMPVGQILIFCVAWIVKRRVDRKLPA